MRVQARGCEEATPVRNAAEPALPVRSAAPHDLPAPSPARDQLAYIEAAFKQDQLDASRYPRWMRALILVGGAAASWSLVLGGGWLLTRLVAR